MNKSDESSRDSGVLSSPLSFLHSGYLSWANASLDGRGICGDYWLLRSVNALYSNLLYFETTYLSPQSNGGRGNGYAVRCVASGGLAPDSICPKGWQLPTYSGDKSFTTLIITSYSMKNSGQTDENNIDSGLLSNPLSFIHGGLFLWYYADLDLSSSNGFYWSLHSANTSGSDYLAFNNTYLSPQDNSTRGYGIAVRCLGFF